MPKLMLCLLALLALAAGSALVAPAQEQKEKSATPAQPATRDLVHSVRTLIELSCCDEPSKDELQKIYDMLRKLDTDKSGKLDPKAIQTEGDAIMEHRVKAAFERLDTDKDGKISKEEARGLIKDHFDRIDTNKNGFIEYDELLKAAKERREHPQGKDKPAAQKPVTREER